MPTPVIIILIVVGALLLLGLLFSVFFTFLVAYKVYSKTLMRDAKSHWGREHCSEPGNPALETILERMNDEYINDKYRDDFKSLVSKTKELENNYLA